MKLTIWIVAVLLLLGFASRCRCEPKPDDLRTPADNAKLKSILLSVGVTESYTAEVRPTMTDAEAKDLLWQAFEMTGEEPDYASALERVKRVLAFDPDFRASYWPEKKVEAGALDMLEATLRSMGDWQRARPVCELNLRMTYLVKPDADTFGTAMVERCRKALAQSGKTDFRPYVTVLGIPMDDQTRLADGVVMVPASQFAACLKMAYSRDGDAVRLERKGRALSFVVGQPTANNGAVRLPAPPQKGDPDILIPLRTATAYFGGQLKWDPVTRIAEVTGLTD